MRRIKLWHRAMLLLITGLSITEPQAGTEMAGNNTDTPLIDFMKEHVDFEQLADLFSTFQKTVNPDRALIYFSPDFVVNGHNFQRLVNMGKIDTTKMHKASIAIKKHYTGFARPNGYIACYGATDPEYYGPAYYASLGYLRPSYQSYKVPTENNTFLYGLIKVEGKVDTVNGMKTFRPFDETRLDITQPDSYSSKLCNQEFKHCNNRCWANGDTMSLVHRLPPEKVEKSLQEMQKLLNEIFNQ